MLDLLVIETGNGGDLRIAGNDLETIRGYENMPYLSMFGGADWWANDLITEPTQRMQSLTEAALLNNALTSSGRIAIIRAIEQDLAFLTNQTGALVAVEASITGPDRLEISINIDGQTFYLEWNPSNAYLNYKV